MNKVIETALLALGVSAGEIEKMQSEDEAVRGEVTSEGLVSAVTSASREALRNDSEFINEFSLRERYRVLDSKRNKLKNLAGLTAEEMASLPEKDFDAWLEFALNKVKGSSGKGKEELNSKIEELNGIILERDNQLNEIKNVTIPEIEGRISKEQDSATLRGLTRSPLSGENPVVFGMDAEMGHSSVVHKMSELYDLKLNEGKNSIVLYEKGKDVIAYKDNVEVGFNSEYKRIATDAKMVKASNGSPDNEGAPPAGGTAPVVNPSNSNRRQLPGEAAAEANVGTIGNS